jgi:hypothetical protein
MFWRKFCGKLQNFFVYRQAYKALYYLAVDDALPESQQVARPEQHD